MKNYTVWFDGSCINNPGPMSGEYLIQTDGYKVYRQFPLGAGTNNRAEYGALDAAVQVIAMESLTSGVPLRETSIQIYGDSMVVIKQLKGEYGCNDEFLRRLRDRILHTLQSCQDVTYEWRPRDEVNAVLEAR